LATRTRQRRRSRRGRPLRGLHCGLPWATHFEQDCRVCSRNVGPFWKPESPWSSLRRLSFVAPYDCTSGAVVYSLIVTMIPLGK
jgi:hypothetical protein